MPITPALPAQQHEAIVAAEVRPRDQDAAAVFEAASGARPDGRARSARRCPSARSGTATRSSADAPGILSAARRRRRQRRDAGDRRQARRARAGRGARLARLATTASCSRRGRSSGSRIRTRAAATRYFDPAFDPALRAWLARPCGPAVLRRRAHQHQVAGLHERRGRERPPRRGRNRRDARHRCVIGQNPPRHREDIQRKDRKDRDGVAASVISVAPWFFLAAFAGLCVFLS